jgi:pentatricopeptide repeat protein
MRRTRLAPSLIFLILLSCLATSAPLTAQLAADAPPPDNAPAGVQMAYWFREAARAFETDQVDQWVEATEKLHAIRPYDQDYMTHLVRGYARQGDISSAFDTMLKMQKQGLAENWERFEDVASLRQYGLYEHLSDLMTQAGEPYGQYEDLGMLPEPMAMPEGIARHPDSGRLFVGGIKDGRILTSENGNEWSLFASPDAIEGLASVFALVVDAERGHLWVATSMVPQFDGFNPDISMPSALIRLDLESGEFQDRYLIEGGGESHVLGSMALASDGTVYAADTLQPVVFRLEAGGDALQPFFGNRNFSSLRGLALSGDDRLLYMADYEQGVFVLATDGSNQGWKLAVPETLNEGGIDGLYWWNDHLVAIQNGIRPQRVIRLKLGPDGLGVVAVAPVLAGLKVFDTPTFGAMDGSELVMFSGSHWQHVDGRGEATGNSLPSIRLIETDVDADDIMAVGQEALEQLQRGG